MMKVVSSVTILKEVKINDKLKCNINKQVMQRNE